MTTLVFTAVLLLALGPGGVSQSIQDKALPGPRVTVHSIEAAKAYAPGSVAVKGKNLGLVRELRLNGMAVPIVSNNGRRILIEPGVQDPGFGVLEVVLPHRTMREAIEFMPSLLVRWRANRFKVRLNPGGYGWYILNYSYRQRNTPRVYPHVYYMEMLDMTRPHSGWLASGTFSYGEVVESPWMRVPPTVNATGNLASLLPVNLQAICMIDNEMCFSNMQSPQGSM